MSNKIHQWFLRLPHKFHWFLVVLTAAVIPWLTRNHPDTKQRGEWYPFSNFPMYSNFEKTAYYVYVADENGKALPMEQTFGSLPSEVKKMYDRKLKDLVKELKADAQARGTTYKKRIVEMSGEECRPAGDAALRQLRENSRHQDRLKQHPGFRLYQVDIKLDDQGNIVKNTKLVGEI